MKSKRGSHVGVILSFVVFVTFVVFLYSVLEPAIQIDNSKQSLAEYLKTELIEKFSADLVTATVIVNDDYVPDLDKDSVGSSRPENPDCLKFKKLNELEGMDFIVKDSENEIVNSRVSETDIEVDWNLDDGERFFKIFYSEEKFSDFPLSTQDCFELTQNDYIISSTRITNHLFVSKIDSVDDYDALKKELNIPAINDFSFRFIEEDLVEHALGDEGNAEVDIYVEELPVQYVDDEANINSGSLIIEVW